MDSLLSILAEGLAPLRGGGRFCLRVRLKPSWSGRVYGTYAITARPLLLALVLCGATFGLFLRLLALNLALAGGAAEATNLVGLSAHQQARRDVWLPAQVRSLEQRAEELAAHSHQLSTILGVRATLPAAAGLGSISIDENPNPLPRSLGPLDRLARVEGEIGRLDAQYARLGEQLISQEEELRFTPSIVPLFQAEFIPTSTFGRRISPFTKLPEEHRGQDLAAEMYSKIVATADGTVVFVENDPRKAHMGRYVVIDHSGRYETWYGHCERVFVQPGDVVRRHQIIAEVGTTGRSTGPHVHYEVRIAGKSRDPRHFMVFDPHFRSADELRYE